MGDCCKPDGYGSVFSRRFARRSAKRYRKNGLTPSAADIVAFATDQGIEGASVLEIGGGIGHLQVELLRAGAANVTNLEISENYEGEAAALLESNGLTGKVSRRFVDIAAAPESVEAADIVILHRVVCCYPDYDALLTAAGDHARRALVFSHPPANVLSRFVVLGENAVRRLQRNPFRTFVHSPDAMVEVLEQRGLEQQVSTRSRGWNVVGLVRASDAAA